MPSNCDRSDVGDYAVRHNPPTYYTTLSGCSSFDVPYSQLAGDLANNALPAFSFITPNLINDMHDGTLADGDNWLANHLPTILDSNEYRDNTTAIFLTWDEGEGGSSNDCAANTTDVGCHVGDDRDQPQHRCGHPVGGPVQPLLAAGHRGRDARAAQVGAGRVSALP